MEELLKYLAAGGNLSMMALVVFMWRFDRRLVKIETKLGIEALE